MKQIPIARITEQDFDSIVEACGGKRLVERSETGARSADYRLNETIIELKFVEEPLCLRKQIDKRGLRLSSRTKAVRHRWLS